MIPRSLRFRLALGTGLVSVFFFAGAVGVSYRFIHGFFVDEFDIELREKALLFAEQTRRRDTGAPRLHFSPASPVSGGDRKEFAELWDAGGVRLGREPAWSGDDLVPHPSSDAKGVNVILPNGSKGRQVTLVFEWRDRESPSGPPRKMVLAVAQDDAVLEATLRRIFIMLAVSGLIAAICTMLGVTLVIGRLLAPVRRLAAELDGISQHDLSARLGGEGAPLELQPVVRGLNALLARLETAFEREKTLTADLAHELRTPLHGLRLTLDVALTRPREAADYRRTLEECQAMVAATQAMAQDLLTLARLDADRSAVGQEPVSLLPLLQDCWQPLAARAEARRLMVDWCPRDARVLAHPERLRLVLSSLLGNAVDHADEGGRIRVGITEDGDQAVFSLANTGSQVAPADTAKVFDRFWRQDSARGGDAAHCGLGLAIVRRVADLMGMPIHVKSEVGGWFEVVLRLPKDRG